MSQEAYLLEDILSPRSVAILGVSRSSYKRGRVAAKQLIEGGFPGDVYLINPTIPEVLGRTTYASLLDVPSIACISATAR